MNPLSCNLNTGPCLIGATLLITLAAVPFRTVKSVVLMKNNKDVCISMYASLSGSKHKVLPISKVGVVVSDFLVAL